MTEEERCVHLLTAVGTFHVEPLAVLVHDDQPCLLDPRMPRVQHRHVPRVGLLDPVVVAGMVKVPTARLSDEADPHAVRDSAQPQLAVLAATVVKLVPEPADSLEVRDRPNQVARKAGQPSGEVLEENLIGVVLIERSPATGRRNSLRIIPQLGHRLPNTRRQPVVGANEDAVGSTDALLRLYEPHQAVLVDDHIGVEEPNVVKPCEPLIALSEVLQQANAYVARLLHPRLMLRQVQGRQRNVEHPIRLDPGIFPVAAQHYDAGLRRLCPETSQNLSQVFKPTRTDWNDYTDFDGSISLPVRMRTAIVWTISSRV